jgi:hypothetical protein
MRHQTLPLDPEPHPHYPNQPEPGSETNVNCQNGFRLPTPQLLCGCDRLNHQRQMV